MYNLNIQYHLGIEATIPNAISRQPNFIKTSQAYQAQFNSIRLVDKYNQEQAIVTYLYIRKKLTNKKLYKAVLKDKNHPPSSFILERDSLLYKKTDNGQAPYLAPLIRLVYLKQTHKNYSHLRWLSLKDILKN